MTVTEAPPQESTEAYPLDGAISDLEGILGQLREAAGHTDGPLALKLRAALARKAAGDLARLPLRLRQEARECDAEAAAFRAAAEAREVLERAADSLRDAEEAYETTAEPERTAAARATEARQLAEQAADRLAQAEHDGAEPAPLAELHGAGRDTGAVLEHQARKLADAQQARQSAREALDRARGAHRKAQAGLAAAEDAAAHPAPESLSREDLFEDTMFAFPDILFGQQKPTPQQLEMCRYHACAVVDDFNWTPPRAEARIRQQIAREMAATARQGHAVEISDGRGTLRLVASPLGMAGASKVATVALGR